MKQRFSSLDVRVIAHELSNALCTLRLSNVYDLSSRIFLLKFAKPNNRQQMVIECGFRCHLTSFSRETAAAPSMFVTRLRKFLRTRRVTAVSQIGTDRVIELDFSDGQYKLFLEFYAGGNIVLTDKDLTILSLQRIVPPGQGEAEARVGLTYSVEKCQNYGGVPALTRERVKEALEKALERAAQAAAAPAKKGKKKTGDALRKALSASIHEFPPTLIDHALKVKAFDGSVPVDEVLKDEKIFDGLMEVLDAAQQTFDSITNTKTATGYIIAKPMNRGAKSRDVHETNIIDQVPQKGSNLLYDDFFPYRPAQFEGTQDVTILEFEGFNSTVDEFFSSLESQKLESRLTEREENAKRKLDNARKEHQKRVGGLQQIQELNIRKAEAIEANLPMVQAAINAVNSLIAQGMDWTEIARLIEMGQAQHNAVAEVIKLPLKLYENTVTLRLLEADFEDEEDFEGDETGSEVSDSEDDFQMPSEKSKSSKHEDKRLTIDVDLALSPYSNARQYYDQKKTAAVKEQRTLQSSEKALKSTERKITADLNKALKQEKEVLRPVRRQQWFEKYFYFISSEGYLIVGGRDDQQHEILYRRYLKKGDIYVHSDISGGSPIIIKNNPSHADAPIPPSTLSQAGTLAVATSSAWESKAGMSAWWVNPEQVSKMASNGEFLQPGNFEIKGKKSFLPPAQLLLGFAVMFRISRESKTRHTRLRVKEDDAKGAVELDDVKQPGVTSEGEGEEHTEKDLEMIDEIEDHASDMDDPVPEQSSDREVLADQSEPEAEDEIFQMQDEPGPEMLSEIDQIANEKDEDQAHTAIDYRNPLQTNSQDVKNLENSDEDESASSEEGPDDIEKEEIASKGEVAAIPAQSDQTQAIPPSNPSSSAQPTHRHLSTKERRLLRAGKAPSLSQSTTTTPPLTSTPPSPTSSATPSSTSKPIPKVRGKKAQLRKQKDKYAHQDDGDRALALALLGSNPSSQPKAQASAEQKASQADFLAAQKQRRREQHLQAVQQGKLAEANRESALEERGEMLDEEVEELKALDCWVGTPRSGDEVLDAMVVCGAWDAVGNKCRWRVKVQPGVGKKGKVVREVLGGWVRTLAEEEKKKKRRNGGRNGNVAGGGDAMAERKEGEGNDEEERLWTREAELIRGLRETEVVGVIPVRQCRILGGGGGDAKKGAGGKGQAQGKRGGRGSKKGK